MALIKSIDTDFGVAAAYWNIGAAQEDFRGGGVQVTLYGWVDKAARVAGKQPMASAQMTFSGDAYTADMDRAALYVKVKAKDQFADAADD